MAAISMPSYHSVSRRGATFENFPAALKRTRDPSQESDVPQFTKKQKIHPQAPSRPKSYVRTYSRKSNPTIREITVQDAVTQVNCPRDRSSVQQNVDRESTPIGEIQKPITQVNDAIKKPLEAIKQEEKRTLRSQDGGSRSKSELASYFPNYDDIVSDKPKEPGKNPGPRSIQPLLISTEFLTVQTRIHVIDESTKSPALRLHKVVPPKNGLKKLPPYNPEPSSVNGSLLQNLPSTHPKTLLLFDAQCIDFPALEQGNTRGAEDPLNDEVYAKAHRRAERSEKHLRNIEKERAMHEKAQLERLLDGLKGHHWLKIMGVSGVTDGEKKSWEPKRDYFIREVETLLEKFREWKEEEKRRKEERDGRLCVDDDDEEDEETPSNVGTPDDSDVGTSVAKQLHQETITGKGRQKRGSKGKGKQPTPAPKEKPFTSFYSKPYLREAALGKHRRGRTRLAFGQPLPNILERDFSLPENLLKSDALAASARSRRRARRGSKV